MGNRDGIIHEGIDVCPIRAEVAWCSCYIPWMVHRLGTIHEHKFLIVYRPQVVVIVEGRNSVVERKGRGYKSRIEDEYPSLLVGDVLNQVSPGREVNNRLGVVVFTRQFERRFWSATALRVLLQAERVGDVAKRSTVGVALLLFSLFPRGVGI